MADDRRLEHNPNFEDQICCWSAIGENVGVVSYTKNPQGDMERLHMSFMSSPEHRRNITDSRFNEIGLGIHVGPCPDNYSSNRCVWVTQDFRARR